LFRNFLKMRKSVKIGIIVVSILLAALYVSLFSYFTLVRFWPRPPIDKSLMVGKYMGYYDVFPKITTESRKGIYGQGTHSLELRSDGTYVHLCKTIDGQEVRNTNTWEFYLDQEGYKRIKLYGFVFGSKQGNAQQARGLNTSVERSSSGKIRICMDVDFEYYFIKQEN
jgi:hypothetical protein